MSAVIRRSRIHLRAVPSQPEGVAPPVDDIKIARSRMRHLAPWNVVPVPAMHSAAGTPNESLDQDARERSRRLALQVLAVQMWHAAPRSALR